MLEQLPDWIKIIFLSMIPWFESRYVMPLAMLQFSWEWWQVFPLAVLGNMIPVPFVLLFFHLVEKFLRNFTKWSKLIDRLFDKTRRRADAKIRRYEYLGLIFFVAIPLPFTGAWTGSLIAYLFDLNFRRSILVILVGVLIAASIMTVLTLSGSYIWLWINT